MPSHRCKQCDQPLVEIDHCGERLRGCPKCNRWQASTGEWCRLALDDIIALRALKATKIETGDYETRCAAPKPRPDGALNARHGQCCGFACGFALHFIASESQ